MMIGSSDSLNERFPCAVCGKSYLRKRHLQRHMRDECIGIPPRFSCDLCPSRFRRKYHMVRHLTSKHNIPQAVAQQTSGSVRSNNARPKVESCDSPPCPENLSLKREAIENENMLNSKRVSPIPQVIPMPTYGLTGAITAISGVSAVGEDSPIIGIENIGVNDDNGQNIIGSGGGGGGGSGSGSSEEGNTDTITIKTEPLTPSKNQMNMMEEDWKMKLSMQLLSNSLLKERLMNAIPFAYSNNN
ncbi:zinc finger protein ZIC 2-like [Teleopsis dalmanni]|uniref:zinc finger protein ZIC 2-like n=1 Tax=Teleopsis dalmanni TaxID=139649 RepID=UPI0018CDD450|nr:zinc finger protein ZIC 2-like [Teleopsis dalmanni]